MTRQFIADRIEVTKAQIVAYEDAFAAFADEGIQSYTLDTGQTRQVVTRANLTELRKTLDGLYNRLTTLEARTSGASHIARPAF